MLLVCDWFELYLQRLRRAMALGEPLYLRVACIIEFPNTYQAFCYIWQAPCPWYRWCPCNITWEHELNCAYISHVIYASRLILCVNQEIISALNMKFMNKHKMVTDYIVLMWQQRWSIGFTLMGTTVAQWYRAGLQVNRLSNWSCTWGMIHIKFHLISPYCPQANIPLQCIIVTFSLKANVNWW